MPTLDQFSAGGVAFRRRGPEIEVALISVGAEGRWQLPKGRIDLDEAPETAAMREVREEAGLETEMLGLIDRVEYWYIATNREGRVRFHKFVHFYLLRYRSGDVRDHDQEVNEARWFGIDEAQEILAFATEKRMVARAREMIASLDQRGIA
jgi:8-oxo-dGTP pyrophosphatase MutT (NUDIX family)